MFVVIVILKILHIIFAILLIAGVLMMQTKSDSGLAGIMGGTGSHTLRSIKGLDENFRIILMWIAIGFMVTSLLNAFLAQ